MLSGIGKISVAAELSAKMLHSSSGDEFADGSAQDPTAPLAAASEGQLRCTRAAAGLSGEPGGLSKGSSSSSR